jgi:hypothetical protein
MYRNQIGTLFLVPSSAIRRIYCRVQNGGSQSPPCKELLILVGTSTGIVDPKLFFSDPEPDPIFVRVLDPDPL